MSFINVGAYVDGKRPKSKKALKEALRDIPSKVRFDRTSIHDHKTSDIWGDNIPAADILTVVGPDPYVDRRWYASVVRRTDGLVKLS